jgi:parvulin-like peptidyl-prolyl isomerase
MSDKEAPSDPKETTAAQKKRPPVKPRKKFVAKKQVFKSDKPMELRVRHIRLSSLEAAQLIRQTVVDFQKDLAAQPMVDVDKEILDQARVEKFFAKLAKKYSACPSRTTGGDLGWVHKKEKDTDSAIRTVERSDFMDFLPQYEKSHTKQLIEAIMKCERHQIPEPAKTASGFHIILVCESRFYKVEIKEEKNRDLMDDVHKNAFHAKPKVWEEKFGPN